VLTRYKGEYPMAKPKEIDYMDVSPKQIVSAAASA
jgi:DNA-directed RNA polymerase beta subunit